MELIAARRISIAVTAILAAIGWAGTNHFAAAGSNTVLIFDASNSMNSPFDRSTRLDVLKEAVAETAVGFNDKLDLGVVTFGSREKQNCGDIQTLVPPGPGGAARAAAAVQSIKAQGVSGVAHTLRAAAEEVTYQQRPASIVLVADGSGVDNCRMDTCEVAADLARDAANLTIHVIAVAARSDDVPSLQCIATATGGSFAEASDKRSLSRLLTAAFSRAAAASDGDAEIEAAVATPRPKPDRAPSSETRPPDSDGAALNETAEPAAEETDADPAESPDPPAETVQVEEDEEELLPLGQRRPRPKPTPGDSDTDVFASDTAGETTGPNVSVFAPTGAVAEAGAGEDTAAGSDTTSAAVNESLMAPSQGSQVAAVGQSVAPPSGTTTDTNARTLGASGAPAEAAEFGGVSASLPAPAQTTILVRRGARPPTTAGVGPSLPAASQPAPAAGEGKVKLAAYIIADTKPVGSGLEWQVIGAAGADAGKIVARSTDAAPELAIPAGEYQVRGKFGHAARTAAVKVEPDALAQIDLVLDAGGLQIIPLNDGTQAPDSEVLNTIYTVDDPTRPVVQDAASGQIVYLNAGVYRIESRYGNANAAAVADIKVQAGKLTKAKINHRAGSVMFKLVAAAGDPPLEDVVWQVISRDGRVIAQSRETSPDYVFAEGTYDVVAQRAGQAYRSSFEVKPANEIRTVEVVAR